jgi:hypothetical protein
VGVKPKFANVRIKKTSPGSKHAMETLKLTYQRRIKILTKKGKLNHHFHYAHLEAENPKDYNRL